MAKMRQHTGVAETQEDRDRDKERTRMADKFEDMVKDRHWSEKGRELMTERDWRIFREDFNIAYRYAGLQACQVLGASAVEDWRQADGLLEHGATCTSAGRLDGAGRQARLLDRVGPSLCGFGTMLF